MNFYHSLYHTHHSLNHLSRRLYSRFYISLQFILSLTIVYFNFHFLESINHYPIFFRFYVRSMSLWTNAQNVLIFDYSYFLFKFYYYHLLKYSSCSSKLLFVLETPLFPNYHMISHFRHLIFCFYRFYSLIELKSLYLLNDYLFGPIVFSWINQRNLFDLYQVLKRCWQPQELSCSLNYFFLIILVSLKNYTAPS